ncbi:prephenate dehydrogenase [Parvibium lacunae]|uniref:Prephenate dehydrogenase/arogenate dehydrogenase family protein n=1 Tax=Parvibium lacunae TaxID=1888893 RepID=A0A368L4K0_9BURK|nr:prephenate dehydrogenase/arogenate dehydrogenase family protein [Parvibium lacunae]RCS58511.1 prephenate dehydrogenase/arogenate dehydrogenase family protein [Parvibium lacunae]
MSLARLQRVAVLGVGLIGGSFARAIKQAVPTLEVVGLAREPARLSPAQAARVVDDCRPISPASVTDVDFLLLAAPVSATQAVLETLAPGFSAQVVLSDAGSTKQDVDAAARLALGARYPRFVPAHPIAGSEQSGWQAAQAGLFVGRRVILTPTPETDGAALALTRAVWEACGAQVSELGVHEHDAVFAQVSHFPHFLAYAYMQQILQAPNAATLLAQAGTGFRDFTRIAGSEPKMWVDISLANRANVLQCAQAFQASLGELIDLLQAGDSAALEARFTEISGARRTWHL